MSCPALPHGPFLYSTLASDPDLAELVELFVAEMPTRITSLLDDYHQARWDQLGRTAHQLKGAAGSYGFHQLTPYAAQLEAAVRGGASHAEILQSLEQLAQLCQCLTAGTPLDPQ